MVTITRVRVGRTSKDTHEIKAIQGIWNKYSAKARDNSNAFGRSRHFCVDPFARNCPWGGKFTNDIDITTSANYKMDALEFIKEMQFDGRSFKIGILDPPFSARQSEELYSGPTNLYAANSPRLRAIEKELPSLIVPGGYIIKAGFNSNPPRNDLELVEIRILSFGGVVNDWLVSVWRNPNQSLRMWTP